MADLSESALLRATETTFTANPPPPEPTPRNQGSSKADDSTAEQWVGKVIGGRYRLEKILGEGGMGAVFLASQPQGPEVAVKLIRDSEAERTSDAFKRFMREARATRASKSPHVVRVLDADLDATHNTPYLVMELLKGRDLAQVLREQGALDPSIMARVFVQACRGLEVIHRLGIIHRDIKPSNLFLHEEGDRLVTKVCDFGVAKQSAASVEGSASDLTHTGGIVGSPHYMSPEQVQDSKHVDERTDIWSLAMALYEVLSGQKGWASCSSVGEVLVSVCTRDVPSIQEQAPWVQAGLAGVIHQGLRRNKDERFASISEMASALEPFAAPAEALVVGAQLGTSQEVRARKASPLVSRSGTTLKAPQPSARRPILVAAAALTAVALAGGAALWNRPAASASAGEATSARPATPEARVVTGELLVSPPTASVWVGGKPQPLRDGKLSLSGAPGEGLKVEVEAHGKKVSQTVMLTSNGLLIPEAIVVPPAASLPAASTLVAPQLPPQPGKQPTRGTKPAGPTPEAPRATATTPAPTPTLIPTW